jgi:hypothetical protein
MRSEKDEVEERGAVEKHLPRRHGDTEKTQKRSKHFSPQRSQRNAEEDWKIFNRKDAKEDRVIGEAKAYHG